MIRKISFLLSCLFASSFCFAGRIIGNGNVSIGTVTVNVSGGSGGGTVTSTATFWVQNSLTPSISTQSFSVSTGIITGVLNFNNGIGGTSTGTIKLNTAGLFESTRTWNFLDIAASGNIFLSTITGAGTTRPYLYSSSSNTAILNTGSGGAFYPSTGTFIIGSDGAGFQNIDSVRLIFQASNSGPGGRSGTITFSTSPFSSFSTQTPFFFSTSTFYDRVYISTRGIQFPDGTVQVSSAPTSGGSGTFITTSTAYIQNTASPTTTTQTFNVFTGQFTGTGSGGFGSIDTSIVFTPRTSDFEPSDHIHIYDGDFKMTLDDGLGTTANMQMNVNATNGIFRFEGPNVVNVFGNQGGGSIFSDGNVSNLYFSPGGIGYARNDPSSISNYYFFASDTSDYFFGPTNTFYYLSRSTFSFSSQGGGSFVIDTNSARLTNSSFSSQYGISSATGIFTSSLTVDNPSITGYIQMFDYDLGGTVQYPTIYGKANGGIFPGGLQLVGSTNAWTGSITNYDSYMVLGGSNTGIGMGAGSLDYYIGRSTITAYKSTVFNSTMSLSGGRIVQNIAPTSGQVLKWDGNKWKPDTDSTGAGSPGGSNNQIQVNNAGSFAGYSYFVFDSTNGTVEITAQSSPNNWVEMYDASNVLRAKINDRGGFGSFASYGDHSSSRMGEIFFYDLDGAMAGDGGTFNCDWTGSEYDWHWDSVQSGAGTRIMSANLSQGINSAVSLFSVNGTPGATGTITDSLFSPRAEVVGGIITVIY